ncbi:MAG: SPFH domain-containing protein [Leptonema sp. (in: bacteria)]
MRFLNVNKVYVVLLLILLSYIFYKSFVKTGYHQVILIEDRDWGVERKIIPPDSYAFVFRNLIPNKIHLHSVVYKSQHLNFLYVYPLSANQILGLDDSFSIKLDLVYFYDLDIYKIPELFIKLPNRNWKDLNSYLEIKLRDLLYQIFKEKLAIEENLEKGEEILKDFIHNGFLQDINKVFQSDGIQFVNVYIQEIYVPNVEQYRLVLQQRQKFIEKKMEISAKIDEAKAQKESNLILFDYEKKRLEEIANLLRKYPELKDYLKIEKMSTQAKFIYMPTESFWSNLNPSKFSLTENLENQTKENSPKKILNLENQKAFVDKTPP